ncbi:MAG: VOC family protein [Candidatus Pacebacteria bacterium]|nr:VOC family protein [Candidatus Paceibacterota bacterium]
MSNRIIHFEIQAADTAKVAEFYKSVFGWEINKVENMDYWLVMTAPEGSTEPGINGGITLRNGPMPQEGGAVNAFVCTISVPSVDEFGKKIEAAGGKVQMPKMPITGMAWIAYYTDIEGNSFGIYEDDKNAK